MATVTDINGTYTLQLPTVGVTIRFAYMGFKEKTVRVTKSAVIDVALEENVSALNEVVVVGYGTQKKASVVGAINNLEPSKLNLVSSRSMSNGFAGMVPGIGVTTPTFGVGVSVALLETRNLWYLSMA